MRRIHLGHRLASSLAFLALLLVVTLSSPGQQPKRTRPVSPPPVDDEIPVRRPLPVPRVLPAKATVKFLCEHFQKRYLAFEKSFTSPLRELTADDGTPETYQVGTSKGKPGTITVQCCQELANLPAQYVHVGTSTKYLPQLQYQECFALAVARFGQTCKQSFFDHDRLGDDLFKSLRSEVFWTDRYKEFETRGGIDYLQELPFTSIHVTPTLIELDYKYPDSKATFSINFRCLAAADFDGDGFEDILVMSDQFPSDGSYLDMHPIMFSRKTEGGKLERAHSDFLVSCLLGCKQRAKAKAKNE